MTPDLGPEAVFLCEAVRPDGTLDSDRVARRETLYVGRNGKAVERFWLDVGGGTRSFIFKPLTNDDTAGREIWAYAHVVPAADARVPRMLAHHACGGWSGTGHWIIYEDLGMLRHRFRTAIARAAACAAASWHGLMPDFVPEGFRGHSPTFGEISVAVAARWPRLSALARELGLGRECENAADRLFAKSTDEKCEAAAGETVVAHGDYHPSNIAVAGGELVVLDWEYVHRNSAYWDLYNLLDITSPRYRRLPPETRTRQSVLRAYAEGRRKYGRPIADEAAFERGYYGYAAMHAAWILSLIERDLEREAYDRAALVAQREETAAILRDCLLAWSDTGRV